MLSNTTHYSQPIRATPPQPMMKKVNNDAKPLKEKFSWGAACMLTALALAVFVGDVLLMEHNSSGHSDGPLNRYVNRFSAWIWTEMCSLDGLLFSVLATMLFLHSLFSSSSKTHGNKSKFFAAPRFGNKSRMNGPRKQATRHASGQDGSASSQSSRGSADRDRTEAEHTNAIVLSRWNNAIDTAARQGDVDKAGKLLLEFERQGMDAGHKPDIVSFNLVIRAHAKKGDVRGAEKWFTRMVERGIQPTLCSYNTVLDACAKADDPEALETWIQRMLERKIEPNVISYATAIYASARRGEEAQAEKWLRAMIDAGIPPDAVAYNSMIHACGVGGNAEGAERWVKEMHARGLETTVTTYTAVIDACAKVGDATRAEKWMEAMITARVQPNVVTYSAMIDACAKAADPTRAEYWHDQMAQSGVKPNAHSFSAVINAFAKSGNAGGAETWLGKSEEAGVANDVVLYSSVIDACGKAGEPERGMTVFRRMQANGIRPHIIAYAGLARPYAYKGDWETVEMISEEMTSSGIRMNEFFHYAQLLAYGTARPRQSQKAEACFRKTLKTGLKPNDHVIGALSRAVGRARCAELIHELCPGRQMPKPTQRHEVRGGS